MQRRALVTVNTPEWSEFTCACALHPVQANAREVREKTLKNGMAGSFGPFSKEAAVMKADGSFEIVSIFKLEKWKDSGKVVVSKSGLDTWAPGFDAAAAEAADAKARASKGGRFLGLF